MKADWAFGHHKKSAMVATTNIVAIARYFTPLYKWNLAYLYNKVP
ncbi:hypothetical protein C427_1862 [Paraglaciecola psychrophila 170]|uniref:Uncharacterized protein n=1 Tax=Paraglaciecola psychrophila 170 TaxID=1129794 RepID=K7APZ7_9ALTE|nr:hypothetical protein C427_1862 [Paraglaciecola psychrophila 170]GAC37370.1 hypothetical protein GPSY_1741 [Paraglaciecola psychrophila 170]